MTMKLMGPMCSAVGDHDACTQQATCQCSCHKTSDPYGLERIREWLRLSQLDWQEDGCDCGKSAPHSMECACWKLGRDIQEAKKELARLGLSPEAADIYVRLVEGLAALWQLADSSSYVGDWADELDAAEAILKDIERNAHD